jgi:hypothetical protein
VPAPLPGQIGVTHDTSGTIDAATADALRAALLDERSAEAFYARVLSTHGRVRPFANIARAERRHIAAVIALMERHGVDVPAAHDGTSPPVPDTLQECCHTAARLERENIAFYDRVLGDVTAADIRLVFENLRAASEERHLPAFERWAARSALPGTGPGSGRGFAAP